MRFRETKRFSPVIWERDLPWENDLFHWKAADIPKTKQEYNKFLVENNIITDDQWWDVQEQRCLNGYTVPNAIERGGDAFIDGLDAIWNDGEDDMLYEEDDFKKVIPPNSCYLVTYDLIITNREVHITGRFYFYLNFWKIYRLDMQKRIKDTMPPKFIDLDFMFSQRIELMLMHELDSSEAKARQKGYSEKMGGMILGYNFHFVRSSVSIVAGGVSDDADHTMENFTKGCDDLVNTQFYKERSKSQEDYYKAKHFLSEVRALSFKDNAQSLSRFSPFMVIYEEIGKFRKGLILEAKQFVDASLIAEGVKTGYAFYIGTGGEMDNGAADLEMIHYNPTNYGCLKYRNKWDRDNSEVLYTGHFTPSWMFRIIDDDGNSLKEKSIQDVLNARMLLKPSDRYTHSTQHALFASDAFLISSGGFFGASIADWCNERKAYLKTHRSAQVMERGRLEWNDRKDWSQGVYFIPDEEGWLLVAEHPELDNNGVPYVNLYKVATDSYDQDEAFFSSSKGSCWVKKGFLNANSTSNKYVAGFLERPELSVGGREVFYEYTALVTVYYGGKNLIEHSNLLIFEWYHNHGMAGLLKLKPEFAMAKMVLNSKTSNIYGIDPSTKPYWLKMQADWLRVKENIDSCDFEMLLEAWAKFKYRPGVTRYNCDVTIATSLCTVMEEDEKEMMVYSMSEVDVQISMPRYQTVNGVMQLIF